MSRYAKILRRRAVLLPYFASLIARFPISMMPLGMVLLVQNDRGSYSVAGGIAAASAISGAIFGPIWGGAMDRHGQPVVLIPTSASCALLLATFALGTVSGWHEAVLVVLAAGVGMTFPPISPAMRAAWRVLLPGAEDRLAAYALDAVAIEVIFVTGPLLVSLLLIFASPVTPLLVTSGFLAVGGLGYATTRAARSCRPETPEAPEVLRTPETLDPITGVLPGESPLRAAGVRMVLLIGAAMAIGFGLNDVGIAAIAQEELGSTTIVGLLFAAIAGGSAVGGLWYGSRSWSGAEHSRLPYSLAGFATGLTAVGLALATGNVFLALLMPLLFLAGLCISPTTIVLANLVDRHSSAGRLSEAQAWLSTSFTFGSAVGTAIGGIAVDAGGAALAFGGAAVAVAGGLGVALVAGPRWAGDVVLPEAVRVEPAAG